PAMAAKRKESEVWAYFNIIADTPHIAKCSLCSTKIARGKADAAKKAYSVKGLWDHLNSKHKEQHKLAKAAQEEYTSKKQKLDNEVLAAKSRLYQLEQAQPSLQDFLTRNQE
ncbi:zinc finger BED domain-containing 4-like, partial [Paramuricea clavata]